MEFILSIFRRRCFSSSRCKTAANLAMARIKVLKNKRLLVIKQMRREIASLLQSGQDDIARIRVGHLIREENIQVAYEIIKIFSERVVARLAFITDQRECPLDLKEGIATLIFAAPRCSEIPELQNLKVIFENKYGREFVSAATELRPTCGVNLMLIDKLSVRHPDLELKLKTMKEIANEFQVDWDIREREQELLKPPEESTDGPCAFVSASSLPINRGARNPIDPTKAVPRSSSSTGINTLYHNSESTAEAGTKLAKQAVVAAQAASSLASRRDSSSSYGKSTNKKDSGYVDQEEEEDFVKTEAKETMKRGPHTHPKLPDYDMVVAYIEEIRQSGKATDPKLSTYKKMEENDAVPKPVVVDPPLYNEAPPSPAQRQPVIAAVAAAAAPPIEDQLIQQIRRALVELRELRNQFNAILRELDMKLEVEKKNKRNHQWSGRSRG